MPLKIRNIIDKIDNGHLFVPAFQREYVWKREQAKSLMNSLIKNYPTGTLLSWETSNPPELKGKTKYNSMMGAVRVILDGQQRITTLYMLITGNIPPYYVQKDILQEIRKLYINLLTLELEYYKPKSMNKNPLWIDLTDIFNQDIRSRHIVNKLREIQEVDDKTENLIDDNLVKIKSILDREFAEQSIPISASIKEAIDIFYIVNSSGVNLTDAELALAQICGYWPEAREKFKEKLNYLKEKGFSFKLDFIVYSILGILYHMGSEMKKLHTPDNCDNIKQTWDALDKNILDYVLNLLQSQAFVDHSSEINTPYALVPIIAYVSRKPDFKLTQIEIKKIIKWFYYSQIRQRYVSQLGQKLDKDLNIVFNSESPFDELLGIINAERPLEISKDEFEGKDVRHPLFSMMKWYFKSLNAVCLGTGLALRKNMGKKYELEDDHIFAYSILKTKGYNRNNRKKYALAQELTNRAVLTMSENRTKFTKEADKYLSEVKNKFPAALKLQCIPENEILWKIENYEHFLDERRKILAQAINNYLINITESDLNVGELTLEEMIEEGENNCLEFKSTLRWDMEEGRVNKKLEEVILKTISAFSNSEGGTLIIGVDDEGEILGLDHDYNTLDEGDKDEFELHLRNLINSAFSIEYATNNLKISFPEIRKKEICRIKVTKGLKPLYLTISDKNGQKLEKFYVRSGNSSQDIKNPSEITEFIKKRFN